MDKLDHDTCGANTKRLIWQLLFGNGGMRSSMDLVTSETTKTAENHLKNHLFKKKFCKDNKSVALEPWHASSHIIPQLSIMEASLWTEVAKGTKLFLSSFQLTLISHLEEEVTRMSHPSPLHVADILFQEGSAERLEVIPSSVQFLLIGQRFYPLQANHHHWSLLIGQKYWFRGFA